MSDYPSKEHIIKSLSATQGAISSAALILNIIVIARISRKQCYTKTNAKADLFILSLAISDIMFATQALIHCLTLHGVIQLSEENHHKVVLSSVLISGMSAVASLFHMVVITLDRYFASRYPFGHRRWLSKRKICLLLLVTWTLSGLITSSQYWTKSEWRGNLIDWVFSLGTIIGSICFLVTYTFIVVKTFKSDKSVGALPKKQKRSHIYTTVLSMLIVLVFVLCNLPFCVTKIIFFDKPSWNDVVSFTIATLLVLNTFLDPIIYSLVSMVAKHDVDTRSWSAKGGTLKLNLISNEERRVSMKVLNAQLRGFVSNASVSVSERSNASNAAVSVVCSQSVFIHRVILEPPKEEPDSDSCL